MSSTAAERIPPELFDNILRHAASSLRMTHRCKLFPESHSKRLIVTCGLVCRHWARACRPWIFHCITLRSPRDQKEFMTLLDSSAPFPGLESFASLIRLLVLRFEYTRDKASPSLWWFHHASMVLIPRLKQMGLHPWISYTILRAVDDVTDLVTDGDSYRRNCSTMVGILPCTTPHPTYHLLSLTIYRTSLHGAEEVLGILSMLPTVRAVTIDSIMWGPGPNDAGRYRTVELAAATSTTRADHEVWRTAPSAYLFHHALVGRRPPRPNSIRSPRPLQRCSITVAAQPEADDALRDALALVMWGLPTNGRRAGLSDPTADEITWHFHREMSEDPCYPVLQATALHLSTRNVPSQKTYTRVEIKPGRYRAAYNGGGRRVPRTFYYKRSFWLKYAPVASSPVASETGGPLVTVALQELHVEVLKGDGGPRADYWAAFAAAVGRLPHLQRLVLVSKYPARAHALVAKHRASAFCALDGAGMLSVGPLVWRACEAPEECKRVAAVGSTARGEPYPVCGGRGGRGRLPL